MGVCYFDCVDFVLEVPGSRHSRRSRGTFQAVHTPLLELLHPRMTAGVRCEVGGARGRVLVCWAESSADGTATCASPYSRCIALERRRPQPAMAICRDTLLAVDVTLTVWAKRESPVKNCACSRPAPCYTIDDGALMLQAHARRTLCYAWGPPKGKGPRLLLEAKLPQTQNAEWPAATRCQATGTN